MYKLLYGLALAAVLLGFTNMGAPSGSPAYREAGFLFLAAPVLLLLGGAWHLAATKRCPQCRSRIARAAARCPRCTAVVG